MDAQSEFVFGESIETLLPDNQAARDFMHHLENAINGTGKRFFAGKWSYFVQDKTYWESCTFVRNYVNGLIDKALAREKDSERSRRVLVYEFAKQAVTREQLLDYLFNVFMPGKDTPGTLLGHVFFARARNPYVWDKLRAEVRNLKQEVLDFENLKSLKYMQYVFNEGPYPYNQIGIP
jgi:cytochrome P450